MFGESSSYEYYSDSEPGRDSKVRRSKPPPPKIPKKASGMNPKVPPPSHMTSRIPKIVVESPKVKDKKGDNMSSSSLSSHVMDDDSDEYTAASMDSDGVPLIGSATAPSLNKNPKTRKAKDLESFEMKKRRSPREKQWSQKDAMSWIRALDASKGFTSSKNNNRCEHKEVQAKVQPRSMHGGTTYGQRNRLVESGACKVPCYYHHRPDCSSKNVVATFGTEARNSNIGNVANGPHGLQFGTDKLPKPLKVICGEEEIDEDKSEKLNELESTVCIQNEQIRFLYETAADLNDEKEQKEKRDVKTQIDQLKAENAALAARQEEEQPPQVHVQMTKTMTPADPSVRSPESYKNELELLYRDLERLGLVVKVKGYDGRFTRIFQSSVVSPEDVNRAVEQAREDALSEASRSSGRQIKDLQRDNRRLDRELSKARKDSFKQRNAYENKLAKRSSTICELEDARQELQTTVDETEEQLREVERRSEEQDGAMDMLKKHLSSTLRLTSSESDKASSVLTVDHEGPPKKASFSFLRGKKVPPHHSKKQTPPSHRGPVPIINIRQADETQESSGSVLQSTLKTIRLNFEMEREGLNEVIARLQNDIADRDSKLHETIAEKHRLELDGTTANVALESLRRQIAEGSATESFNIAIKSELEGIQAEGRKLKKASEGYERRAKEAELEGTRLQGELQQSLTSIRELKTTMDRASSAASEQQRRIKELELAIEARDRKAARMEVAARELRERHQERLGKYEHVLSQTTDVVRSKKDDASTLQSLREKLHTLEEEVSTARLRLLNKDQVVDDLRDKLTQKRDVDTAEIREIETRKDEALTNLSNTEEKFGALQLICFQLEKDKKNFEIERIDLLKKSSAADEMKVRLSELEREVETFSINEDKKTQTAKIAEIELRTSNERVELLERETCLKSNLITKLEKAIADQITEARPSQEDVAVLKRSIKDRDELVLEMKSELELSMHREKLCGAQVKQLQTQLEDEVSKGQDTRKPASMMDGRMPEMIHPQHHMNNVPWGSPPPSIPWGWYNRGEGTRRRYRSENRSASDSVSSPREAKKNRRRFRVRGTLRPKADGDGLKVETGSVSIAEF